MLLAQDVGCLPGKRCKGRAEAAFATKNRRWQLMGWIFGTDVAAESNNFTEAAGALMDRSRQSSPLDCDIEHTRCFSSCIREDGKTSQKTALAFELEPTGTTHAQSRTPRLELTWLHLRPGLRNLTQGSHIHFGVDLRSLDGTMPKDIRNRPVVMLLAATWKLPRNGGEHEPHRDCGRQHPCAAHRVSNDGRDRTVRGEGAKGSP